MQISVESELSKTNLTSAIEKSLSFLTPTQENGVQTQTSQWEIYKGSF